VTAEEVGLAFIRRMNPDMLKLFQESVVPLYARAAGTDHLRLIGTGTLIKVGGFHFVVTAAHVVEEVIQAIGGSRTQTDDFYAPNPATSRFAVLFGELTADRSDKHDIAFVRLADEAINPLAPLRFLSLSEIDASGGPPPPGWHYVHGYPVVGMVSDKRAGTESAVPFTYSSSLYEGDPNSFRIYDPALHVMVELNPNTVIEPSGAEGTIPETLRGISGSSIWRAHKYSDPRTDWTRANARVLAVQTAVSKLGGSLIIRGTRWFVVLALMLRAYPELERVTELHGLPRLRLIER
jgi:hypothetical protein